jgi:S-adenosylmethionine hydrolase
MVIVTLTTDFGGHYAGIMKGVIKTISPAAEIIELSTEVDPFDVKGGAFALLSSYKYFPKGTIHLAVVDPGVGSSRRAIVIRTKNYAFVGPDNGLLAAAAADDGVVRVYEIASMQLLAKEVSRTFHGRDIFAPVAAQLANGIRPEDIGPSIEGFKGIEFPRSVGRNCASGEILNADSFGNITLSLAKDDAVLKGKMTVRIGQKSFCAESAGTYEEGGSGISIIAGSSGFYELAVKGGSAQAMTGAKVGDRFTIDWG